MKRTLLLTVGVSMALCAGRVDAQFRSQVEQPTNVAGGLVRESAPLLFGWFNPDNFHMRHSFNMSYQTWGGEGFSLGTYTNSMMYQIADNLNARADVSFSFSPFSSLPTMKKNDFSTMYVSRAEVNYRPWDNVLMQVQFRQLPHSFGYFSPFYNPWYREEGF